MASDNKIKCCLTLLIFGLIFVVVTTLLFGGFGARVADIYHLVGLEKHFGLIGKIVVISVAIILLFAAWFVLSAFLSRFSRYGVYFFLPIAIAFPSAFALTPFGHQSVFLSLVIALTWSSIIFAVLFLLQTTRIHYRRRRRTEPRKPLTDLPLREEVAPQTLKYLRSERSKMEILVEKKQKFGSENIYRQSKGFDPDLQPQYVTFDDLDTNAMVQIDTEIAIYEYLTDGNVARFRREMASTFAAQWKSTSKEPDISFSLLGPILTRDILKNLGVDFRSLAVIQARFLREAAEKHPDTLSYQKDAIYHSLAAATLENKSGLSHWNAELLKARKFPNRLFEDDPDYWLPYINGLATKSTSLCNEAIRIYAEQHYYRCTNNEDNAYFHLNIQAVGMANLCRIHGIKVEAIPLIVPESLLVKCG